MKQPPAADETVRVRQVYDRLAPGYDRFMGISEKLLFGDGRRWACSQARGDTLEIAVGTGRNLAHYPPDVRLTAVELSPAMLAVARRRADELGSDVDLLIGDAQALPFAAGQFDTLVCTLALCSIPDDRRAVAEARRVLRPAGWLLLLEHVRSPIGPVLRAEQLLDPLLVRLEGDHLLRDPVDYLGLEGFVIEYTARSRWGIVERLVARKMA